MSIRADLAPTPPMGWNSFDCFGGRAREEHLKANADYMAEHLKRHGWEYVVVDIAWYVEFEKPLPAYAISCLNYDEHGRLIPSASAFASSGGGRGFKPLADYVHGKGLKFGIHIMRGIPKVVADQNLPILNSRGRAGAIADKERLCGWWEHMYGVDPSKPGAQEYYDSILALYAEWGVDFIKADDMSKPFHQGEIDLLGSAIAKCGRNIVLSLSPGPTALENAKEVKKRANMWRLSADLWDRWEDILRSFEYCEQWNEHRSPGHWPDLDMLPLGHLELLPAEEEKERWTRLTHDEQITMMTLWCIFRSPLMMGGNLPDNDDWTLSLLTNDEVLEITRSSSGNRQLYRTDEEAVWTARGPQGETYLALFNLREKAAEMRVELAKLGLSGQVYVRDLWAREDIGNAGPELRADAPAHGARLLRAEQIG